MEIKNNQSYVELHTGRAGPLAGTGRAGPEVAASRPEAGRLGPAISDKF